MVKIVAMSTICVDVQNFRLSDMDKRKLQESDIVFINYYSLNREKCKGSIFYNYLCLSETKGMSDYYGKKEDANKA